jgi:hypothetical protein
MVAMREFVHLVSSMERWLRKFCDQQRSPDSTDRHALREVYIDLEMARYGLIGVLSVRMDELRGGPTDGYPKGGAASPLFYGACCSADKPNGAWLVKSQAPRAGYSVGIPFIASAWS